MTETLPHIALGIVCDEQNVLLVEHSNPMTGSNGANLLRVFPGGKIETGETPVEAAVREVLEETGFVVEPLEIIEESKHPEYSVLISYIGCRLVNGEVQRHIHDPAIKQAIWVPKLHVLDYVTSSLNPKIQQHLGIKHSSSAYR
ncbi:MAG: hydrolase [Candidatus Saccharibacteria bacterium]|nr:hydrolase [Candidatus Saccharibacteria bacterium]